MRPPRVRHCRPFSALPDERPRAVAREAILELARQGLARFSQGPMDFSPSPIEPAGMSERDTVAALDAELLGWWDGHRGQPYHYEPTEKGRLFAEDLDVATFDDLARQIGDYPRKRPVIFLEGEYDRFMAMGDEERNRWEEQRRQELTGLTSEEIRYGCRRTTRPCVRHCLAGGIDDAEGAGGTEAIAPDPAPTGGSGCRCPRRGDQPSSKVPLPVNDHVTSCFRYRERSADEAGTHRRSAATASSSVTI